MATLWSFNTPARFWRCQPDPGEEAWQAAARRAMAALDLPVAPGDVEELLAITLGEGLFGPHHFRLSPARSVYYEVKPLLPRAVIDLLKQASARFARGGFPLGWPVEDRYVRFQWEIMRRLLEVTGQPDLAFWHFWPEGRRFAFVLTHDIESAEGQARVRAVADLEESLGFRSVFNFVPESYPLDGNLMQELRERGFEIGVHGLRHDGKLFRSQAVFERRAARINGYLREFGAVGFRAELTHRHPHWMQALEVEYDLSFFDTDPFEPIPGGVMSIWPFTVGRFVELPYTLVQDCTLTHVLGETTPRVWQDKVDFIARHHGMALLIAHPDYARDETTWRVYVDFLRSMKAQSDVCWHALPRDVARWWRSRGEASAGSEPPGAVMAHVRLVGDRIACEVEK